MSRKVGLIWGIPAEDLIFPEEPVATVAPHWCAEHGTEYEKRNGRHGELQPPDAGWRLVQREGFYILASAVILSS